MLPKFPTFHYIVLTNPVRYIDIEFLYNDNIFRKYTQRMSIIAVLFSSISLLSLLFK